jgi:hypothetical protein
MERSLAEPEREVERILRGRCETVTIERVTATLEDVFVAATALRGGGARAA